jgi:hypothetical protein
MTHSPEQQRKLSPEYWDGRDILDASLFTDEPSVPEDVHLSHKKFNYARGQLQYGVGQLAAGNATEIRYEATEFNPELEEGSLVIIDDEDIMRWVYDDPDRRPVGRIPESSGPPVTRPYSSLWLNNQDGTSEPISDLGVERIVFADEHTLYTRSLRWGVIVEQDKTKFIQPFLFNTTKLLPDGDIHTPYAARERLLNMPARPMPVSIGTVNVGPKLTDIRYGQTTTSLARVRSVDIVYPASGSREPAKSRRRWSASLFPRLDINRS